MSAPERRQTDRAYKGSADYQRWQQDALRLLALLEVAIANERVPTTGTMLNMVDVLTTMVREA